MTVPPSIRGRAPVDPINGLALVVVVLLAAVAISPMARVFEARSIAVLAGAAALGTVVAAVAAVRRWRAVTEAVVLAGLSVVGLAWVASGAGWSDVAPMPASLAATVDGLTSGWAAMLTSATPIPAGGEPMVGPSALALLGAWSMTTLRLRARPAALTLVPAVGVFAFSLAATARIGPPSPAAPALFVATALVLLSFPASPPDTGPRITSDGGRGSRFARTGTVAAGAGAAAVVSTLAVGVFLAPNPDRAFDLRSLLGQPVVRSESVSPLAALPAAVATTELVATATLEVPPSLDPTTIDFLPVAVLDDYDGAVWTSEASFTRPVGALGGDRSGRPDVEVAAEVIVRGATFAPFLPALHGLTEVDAGRVAYDRGTSTLVSTEDLGAATSYRFVAEIPQPGQPRGRASDETLSDADAELALTVPETVPAALLDLAREAAAPGDALDALERLEAILSQKGLNDAATPGHSLRRLALYVGAGDERVATDVGTAEQAAAAFALVARLMGIPSRVVVGFALSDVRSDRPFSIASTDAGARAEAWVDGRGWVRFDPSPTRARDLPGPSAEPPGSSASNGGGLAPAPTDQTPGRSGAQGSSALRLPQGPIPAPDGRPLARGWALALGLASVALVSGPMVAKGLRRRRRRLTGSDADQVLGARAEMDARLRERGIEPRPSMTVRDLLDGGASVLSSSSRRAGLELQAPVDGVLYGRDGPARDDRDRAWAAVVAFERELAAGERVLRRARCRLDPRPLRPSRPR